MSVEINYERSIPDKDSFFQLSETTGWNVKFTYTKDQLFQAITNSLSTLSAYQNDQLVGFGRIISDEVYQTFIGDLIVHPDYQKRGIGSELLKRLIEICEESGIKWIQLSCARGKRGFYKKFGFYERPADGPGMQKFLS